MLVKNLPYVVSLSASDQLIVEQANGTKRVSAADLAAILYPLAAIPGLSNNTNPAQGAALVGGAALIVDRAESVQHRDGVGQAVSGQGVDQAQTGTARRTPARE